MLNHGMAWMNLEDIEINKRSQSPKNLISHDFFHTNGLFWVAQMVKNLLVMQETWIWSLNQKDLLEKGMAPKKANLHRYRVNSWLLRTWEKRMRIDCSSVQVSFRRQKCYKISWQWYFYIFVIILQLHSCVWLFATQSWTAARQTSLSFTISQSLLKLMSIESMMPSNDFILCCPLLLLPSVFPSIRAFSSQSALCIRWSKYLSFSFNICPSNEYSELISFRIDWFDLLAVQGTFKSLLQHHSWRHQFFDAQPFLLSSSHICTWLLEKP